MGPGNGTFLCETDECKRAHERHDPCVSREHMLAAGARSRSQQALWQPKALVSRTTATRSSPAPPSPGSHAIRWPRTPLGAASTAGAKAVAALKSDRELRATEASDL